MTQELNPVEIWPLFDELANAAAEETLRHFRKPDLTADSKTAGYDPVTIADKAAEAAIRDLIMRERPLDGIFGEEHDQIPSRSGFTWVIDPIDGTRGYVSGTPTWGTLIALSSEEGPIMGVVDQPYIRERFYGGAGRSEMTGPLGQSGLGTRAYRPLSKATVFSTFPEVGTEEEAAAFRRVSEKALLTRYGCDCYAYALLAAGQIDLVIEAGLQPYDIQAPIAVVEAAGGVVTNWQGGPAHRGGTALAAANAEIHAQALELLQRKA